MNIFLGWLVMALGLYVLQSSFLPLVFFHGIGPDLLLLLTISYAFLKGNKLGSFMGFLLGLFEDLATGSFLGVNIFINMLVGFGCGTANDGNITAISTKSKTIYKNNGKEVSTTNITTTEGQVLSGLIGKDYASNDIFYPSATTTATVYDSLGNAHSIQVLLTKTGENTWELALAGGGDSVTFDEPDGTTTTVSLTKTDLKFDQNGGYVSGSGSLECVYSNGASIQNVALNLAGLTQYSGSTTAFASNDGNAAGTLKSVSIDSAGVITGTYTNGINRQEGQVAVAQFNNAAGLTKTGNSLYTESNNSGTPNVGTVNGLGCAVTPSALEMSNVDMASELTDMIVTQRGYQSNSKIITVSDELLETLINMKR